jgi:hypothetical protein
MRTDVATAVVRGPAADLERIKTGADDLAAAGRIASLSFEPAESGDIEVLVTM